VQGVEVQYYEVIYEDGTVCDLTARPRRAAIHYVCQPDGRGEIYELKETSSCEYEVVVLTSLLCSHSAYGYVLG
jgi:endoplasmic reticulum lectin 1